MKSESRLCQFILILNSHIFNRRSDWIFLSVNVLGFDRFLNSPSLSTANCKDLYVEVYHIAVKSLAYQIIPLDLFVDNIILSYCYPDNIYVECHSGDADLTSFHVLRHNTCDAQNVILYKDD